MYVALRRFQRSNEGATLVEYALLVSVVAVGAIAALGDLLGALNSIFNPVIDRLGGFLP